MNKYFLLLSLFFGQSYFCFSQNYLMSPGASGFHSGVQFSYNSFEFHYAVLPGYTHNGKWTFGLDIGKTKDRVNNLNSTVIRPNISYLLVKQQDEGYPVSFDLNIGYQFNYITLIEFNSRSVQFGMGIHKEINKLEGVKLIPSIFLEGNKITSGPNQLQKEDVTLAYGAQIAIVAREEFYLIPKVILNDGLITFTVKLGLIFGGKTSEEE